MCHMTAWLTGISSRQGWVVTMDTFILNGLFYLFWGLFETGSNVAQSGLKLDV